MECEKNKFFFSLYYYIILCRINTYKKSISVFIYYSITIITTNKLSIGIDKCFEHNNYYCAQNIYYLLI